MFLEQESKQDIKNNQYGVPYEYCYSTNCFNDYELRNKEQNDYEHKCKMKYDKLLGLGVNYKPKSTIYDKNNKKLVLKKYYKKSEYNNMNNRNDNYSFSSINYPNRKNINKTSKSSFTLSKNNKDTNIGNSSYICKYENKINNCEINNDNRNTDNNDASNYDHKTKEYSRNSNLDKIKDSGKIIKNNVNDEGTNINKNFCILKEDFLSNNSNINFQYTKDMNENKNTLTSKFFYVNTNNNHECNNNEKNKEIIFLENNKDKTINILNKESRDYSKYTNLNTVELNNSDKNVEKKNTPKPEDPLRVNSNEVNENKIEYNKGKKNFEKINHNINLNQNLDIYSNDKSLLQLKNENHLISKSHSDISSNILPKEYDKKSIYLKSKGNDINKYGKKIVSLEKNSFENINKKKNYKNVVYNHLFNDNERNVDCAKKNPSSNTFNSYNSNSKAVYLTNKLKYKPYKNNLTKITNKSKDNKIYSNTNNTKINEANETNYVKFISNGDNDVSSEVRNSDTLNIHPNLKNKQKKSKIDHPPNNSSNPKLYLNDAFSSNNTKSANKKKRSNKNFNLNLCNACLNIDDEIYVKQIKEIIDREINLSDEDPHILSELKKCNILNSCIFNNLKNAGNFRKGGLTWAVYFNSNKANKHDKSEINNGILNDKPIDKPTYNNSISTKCSKETITNYDQLYKEKQNLNIYNSTNDNESYYLELINHNIFYNDKYIIEPIIENTWLKKVLLIIKKESLDLDSFFFKLKYYFYKSVLFLYQEGIKSYLGDVANQMKIYINYNFWSASEIAYILCQLTNLCNIQIEMRVKGEVGCVIYLNEEPKGFQGFVDSHDLNDTFSKKDWLLLHEFAIKMMQYKKENNEEMNKENNCKNDKTDNFSYIYEDENINLEEDCRENNKSLEEQEQDRNTTLENKDSSLLNNQTCSIACIYKKNHMKNLEQIERKNTFNNSNHVKNITSDKMEDFLKYSNNENKMLLNNSPNTNECIFCSPSNKKLKSYMFNGGRYAFAAKLKQEIKHFKSKRLGDIIHLVQLAIHKGIFVYSQRILLPVSACEKSADDLYPKVKNFNYEICETLGEVLRIISLLVDHKQNGLVLAQLKQQFILQFKKELNSLHFGYKKLQNLLLSEPFNKYYKLYIPNCNLHRTHIQHKKYKTPENCKIFKKENVNLKNDLEFISNHEFYNEYDSNSDSDSDYDDDEDDNDNNSGDDDSYNDNHNDEENEEDQVKEERKEEKIEDKQEKEKKNHEEQNKENNEINKKAIEVIDFKDIKYEDNQLCESDKYSKDMNKNNSEINEVDEENKNSSNNFNKPTINNCNEIINNKNLTPQKKEVYKQNGDSLTDLNKNHDNSNKKNNFLKNDNIKNFEDDSIVLKSLSPSEESYVEYEKEESKKILSFIQTEREKNKEFEMKKKEDIYDENKKEIYENNKENHNDISNRVNKSSNSGENKNSNNNKSDKEIIEKNLNNDLNYNNSERIINKNNKNKDKDKLSNNNNKNKKLSTEKKKLNKKIELSYKNINSLPLFIQKSVKTIFENNKEYVFELNEIENSSSITDNNKGTDNNNDIYLTIFSKIKDKKKEENEEFKQLNEKGEENEQVKEKKEEENNNLVEKGKKNSKIVENNKISIINSLYHLDFETKNKNVQKFNEIKKIFCNVDKNNLVDDENKNDDTNYNIWNFHFKKYHSVDNNKKKNNNYTNVISRNATISPILNIYSLIKKFKTKKSNYGFFFNENNETNNNENNKNINDIYHLNYNKSNINKNVNYDSDLDKTSIDKSSVNRLGSSNILQNYTLDLINAKNIKVNNKDKINNLEKMNIQNFDYKINTVKKGNLSKINLKFKREKQNFREYLNGMDSYFLTTNSTIKNLDNEKDISDNINDKEDISSDIIKGKFSFDENINNTNLYNYNESENLIEAYFEENSNEIKIKNDINKKKESYNKKNVFLYNSIKDEYFDNDQNIKSEIINSENNTKTSTTKNISNIVKIINGKIMNNLNDTKEKNNLHFLKNNFGNNKINDNNLCDINSVNNEKKSYYNYLSINNTKNENRKDFYLEKKNTITRENEYTNLKIYNFNEKLEDLKIANDNSNVIGSVKHNNYSNINIENINEYNFYNIDKKNSIINTNNINYINDKDNSDNVNNNIPNDGIIQFSSNYKSTNNKNYNHLINEIMKKKIKLNNKANLIENVKTIDEMLSINKIVNEKNSNNEEDFNENYSIAKNNSNFTSSIKKNYNDLLKMENTKESKYLLNEELKEKNIIDSLLLKNYLKNNKLNNLNSNIFGNNPKKNPIQRENISDKFQNTIKIVSKYTDKKNDIINYISDFNNDNNINNSYMYSMNYSDINGNSKNNYTNWDKSFNRKYSDKENIYINNEDNCVYDRDYFYFNNYNSNYSDKDQNFYRNNNEGRYINSNENLYININEYNCKHNDENFYNNTNERSYNNNESSNFTDNTNNNFEIKDINSCNYVKNINYLKNNLNITCNKNSCNKYSNNNNNNINIVNNNDNDISNINNKISNSNNNHNNNDISNINNNISNSNNNHNNNDISNINNNISNSSDNNNNNDISNTDFKNSYDHKNNKDFSCIENNIYLNSVNHSYIEKENNNINDKNYIYNDINIYENENLKNFNNKEIKKFNCNKINKSIVINSNELKSNTLDKDNYNKDVYDVFNNIIMNKNFTNYKHDENDNLKIKYSTNEKNSSNYLVKLNNFSSTNEETKIDHKSKNEQKSFILNNNENFKQLNVINNSQEYLDYSFKNGNINYESIDLIEKKNDQSNSTFFLQENVDDINFSKNKNIYKYNYIEKPLNRQYKKNNLTYNSLEEESRLNEQSIFIENNYILDTYNSNKKNVFFNNGALLNKYSTIKKNIPINNNIFLSDQYNQVRKNSFATCNNFEILKNNLESEKKYHNKKYYNFEDNQYLSNKTGNHNKICKIKNAFSESFDSKYFKNDSKNFFGANMNLSENKNFNDLTFSNDTKKLCSLIKNKKKINVDNKFLEDNSNNMKNKISFSKIKNYNYFKK
ncbi:conserved Plasmodium protein, unknown function [Plasmodium relictum]|uniref:HTH OST-type domain-containing protein n=1 Tax=Plasmodium relictum TaxID=85471 RepID=A0A1J1HBX4_PLARL|nr:conserved Plasmodium protein, unknown function [Plasmodium relictum]CRH01057.1 conserved Plasmodium protein, unknown function [Plasmodium relictum]